MKNVIASIVAVAGLATLASAQVNTAIVFEASTNGGASFSTGTVDVLPGQSVIVRTRVSYTGTAAPVGLASFVFQPTVTNWQSGSDTLTPFVNGGVGGNQNGGVVADNQFTSFGRLTPWGRSAPLASAAIIGHVNNVSGVNVLRIAQTNVSNYIGGTGNTTGGSGVPISQLSNVGRTSNDPAFNDQLQNIRVFTMQLNLGAAGAARQLVVDAPADGFGNRNSTTGAREIYWYGSLTEATGQIRGTAAVSGVTLNIVPAPSALALMGLGGLAAARRRR